MVRGIGFLDFFKHFFIPNIPVKTFEGETLLISLILAEITHQNESEEIFLTPTDEIDPLLKYCDGALVGRVLGGIHANENHWPSFFELKIELSDGFMTTCGGSRKFFNSFNNFSSDRDTC